jgi:hypothetical protein
MNTIMDIMTSTFIGGIVLLLIIKLNLFMSNSGQQSDNELRIQQNSKTLAEILSYDLRKIGYKNEGTSIITAQEKRIKFLADMNAPGTAGHGVIDIVEYFLGDSTEVTGTLNPRDKVLYRVLNETDTLGGPSLGLIDLKFSYLNANALPTAALDSIRYIKAELWIEPIEPVTNFVTGKKDSIFTYWELTIYPRNI